jgi:ADP-ribose pyrophosphatase YjhB (NUDIX family)
LDKYFVRVRAVILRPVGELLTVCESDHGLEQINLPGGVLHFGETLQEALVRHVRDQTGYHVVPTDVAFVVESSHVQWLDPVLDIGFYAQIERGIDRLNQPEAIKNVEWIPLHDSRLAHFIVHPEVFASSKRGHHVNKTHQHRIRGRRVRQSW